jgi:hypothetical protein
LKLSISLVTRNAITYSSSQAKPEPLQLPFTHLVR